MAKRLGRLWLSYPPLLWLLGVGSFLNVVGLSFLWPLNSIYIHDVLGKPLTVAGIVLLLNSGGATLGNLAGGVLFDRIGARPVMLMGLFSSAALVALLGVFDSWSLYVAVMILYGFTVSLVTPAVQALIARAWPEGGRKGFNFMYVANNLGVAFGTAAGGMVAQYSFKLAFFSASFMMLLFAFYTLALIRDPKEEPGQVEVVANPLAVPVGTERIPWLPVGSLFVGLVVCWAVYVQWQGSLAVTMQGMGITLSAYSVLWTLNGAVIVLGQPLIGVLVRFFKTFPSQLYLGAAFFVSSFTVLLWADRYAIFVAGMILLTLGEMLIWPTVPAAAAQISPPSRRGFLQGVVGSGATVGRMIGPLLGGLLFDHTSFRVLILAMVGALSLALIGFSVYARVVGRYHGAESHAA